MTTGRQRRLSGLDMGYLDPVVAPLQPLLFPFAPAGRKGYLPVVVVPLRMVWEEFLRYAGHQKIIVSYDQGALVS